MKKLILVSLFMLLPLTSQALFEVRAGYGSMTTDEDTYSALDLGKVTGFNLDLLIEPPLITDLGFGLRYEKLAFDVGSVGDADLDRIAALVNYRFIDFFAYFGVIGSVGISNNLKSTVSGINTDWDAKLNYSVGLEGGVSLGLFQVGAEVGKFFGKFDSTGNSTLDLSGIYAKALVGFGF